MKRSAAASRLLCVALLASAVVLPATTAGAQAPTTDGDVVYEQLAEGTNEPMQLEVAPDGRVIWIERDGTVNVLTTAGVTVLAAQVPVAGNACEACILADPSYTTDLLDNPQVPRAATSVGGPAEAGLYGILLDNDFATTNLVYLYRAVVGSRYEASPGVFWGEFRLSTFVLDPVTNLLDLSSETEILSVQTEWDHPAHHGGDLEYLPDGTIILTTGDNVEPTAAGGYGPRDHTAHWNNAELTSANPADRRGKILRFREDGSVPDGSVEGEMPNPFLGMEGWNPYIEDSADNVFVGEFAGTPGDGWISFDPYVYALGFKQAWRANVMPNGDIYVSDVGPDAGADDPERGPRGFEELDRVPWGGGTHHGWPRCMGPNWSYRDVNYETLEVGDWLDCSDTATVARPIDPADTRAPIHGMSGAVMYYPSGACDGGEDETSDYDCSQWPIVGSGGKTSEPSLFYPADVEGPLALPDRYRDRLWVLEWSRNYILTIPADPVTGDLALANDGMDRVEPAAYSLSPNLDRPQGSLSFMQGRYMSPIDAAVGPDGAIYFLEYGATFYVGENGRLARIRGASAQLDPAANYGLPVEGAGASPHDAAHAAALPLPLLSVVGLAALGLLVRRRRQAVVTP